MAGYAFTMGEGELSGQNEAELLLMFAGRKGNVRKNYRAFIEDDIRHVKTDELVGGRLRRSLKLSGSEEYEAYDSRIFGNGSFVERLQRETEAPGIATGSVTLDESIRSIAQIFSIEPGSLRQGGRRKELSDARGALCYIAVIKMGVIGA